MAGPFAAAGAGGESVRMPGAERSAAENSRGMSIVADDIDMHFDSRRGELSLSCSPEAFARVRDAVAAAADLNTTAIDGVPAAVRFIVVREVQPIKPRARFGDRLALVGCGVVTFVILFVLIVGLGTIVGWLR